MNFRDEIVEVYLKTDSESLFQNIDKQIDQKDCSVKVAGTWDNWKTKLPMKKVAANFGHKTIYTKNILLKPGIYQYKFIVDDIWVTDPDIPSIVDEGGNENHQVEVQLINPLDRTSKILFNDHEVASWSSVDIQDMPNMSTYGHTINIVGDKIYLFGGRRELGNYRNSFYSIDLFTGEHE